MAESESGGIAESFFKKMGYNVFGRVGKYSLNPVGELKDCVFFHKTLQV